MAKEKISYGCVSGLEKLERRLGGATQWVSLRPKYLRVNENFFFVSNLFYSYAGLSLSFSLTSITFGCDMAFNRKERYFITLLTVTLFSAPLAV